MNTNGNMNFTGESSSQTCCKTNIRPEDKDIISQLPDGVLSYILSFLPTKEAVSTSVLSKRWEYIWTSLSSIVLYCTTSDKQSLNLFLNFVDRLLMFHDDSDIKKFSLTLYGSCKARRVSSWVSTVLKHNCSELHLDLLEGRFILPPSLFTSASLSVLKICMYCCISKVPTLIHLQNLKFLGLYCLNIGGNCSSLFSGCPVLQELILKDCYWPKIKCLTIANSSLKSLTLSLYARDCLEDDDQEFERKLEIYASRLTSFQFDSLLRVDVSIALAPAIIDASVKLYRVGWADNGHLTSKLLGGLSNVKSLCIESDTLWYIYEAEINNLPVFENLTDLEFDAGIEFGQVKGLVEFIKKMPNLESLSIPQGLYPRYIQDPENLQLENCCWPSKLKKFCISNFRQSDVDMDVLKFILKNVEFLETVKIKCVSEEVLESVREELKILPKCSESCLIIVSL